MKKTRERREKWHIYYPDGGDFTNLKEARVCAKELSEDHPDEEISIYNSDDGTYYIDYLNGKCIRDGWTIKKNKSRI